MKKDNTSKKQSSLLLYSLFLITGILITGLCIDKFIILYYTQEISFTLNQMVIEGTEALFSTVTFFISGVLFIVYAILEYNKLLRSKKALRIIATILLITTVLLCCYYAFQYFLTLQSEYMWH